MKKVIMPEENKFTALENVDPRKPIFAKRNGKLVGMVIYDKEGWIVNVGYDFGATGYHETRKDCMESCVPYGYEFFIED